ncbi:MAG: class I SAM-dependent methyltransferase [Hyphomicrobiales bacterium]|nr:MAG: class I SAM-dependent methyltransferase [Hyphomicrobiales bacterium]
MSKQSEFWDERYKGETFAFGEAPNAFLAAQAHRLTAGMHALVPGDGEGRNGVWLAQHELTVTTLDLSPVGVEKARRLAAARNVTIDARCADVATWDWPRAAYDLVASIFLHFAPAERRAYHHRLLEALKPGGLVLLEAYTPRQAQHRANGSVGGPLDPAMLMEPADLAADFAEARIISLEEVEVVLAEGQRHTGPSSVVQLIAERRG